MTETDYPIEVVQTDELELIVKKVAALRATYTDTAQINRNIAALKSASCTQFLRDPDLKARVQRELQQQRAIRFLLDGTPITE